LTQAFGWNNHAAKAIVVEIDVIGDAAYGPFWVCDSITIVVNTIADFLN
jgi:hypothetical protein